MNTSLSTLYADLAVSKVRLDEDQQILDLLSQQFNLSSDADNQLISLIQQRRDKLAAEVKELGKQARELESRRR